MHSHHGATKTVEEHAADVASLLGPRAVVTVPLIQALGMVLAEDVVTRWQLPVFASSAMDGYAVRAADLPGSLPVTGTVFAGASAPVTLAPGTALRIMTGAPVPPGADTVVPIEATDDGRERVAIPEAAELGAFVRPAGSELAAGTVVVEKGTRVGPRQVASAASAGHGRLAVLRPLRVLVVSTGEELTEPGEELGYGAIADSNGPMLETCLRADGAEVVGRLRLPDDASHFVRALEEHLAGTELVISTGGVSVGDSDVVKAALRPLGVQFDRLAMQPGMPQAWGRWRADGPAFVGLPGNPVSTYVSYHLFVRPLLGLPPRRVEATLAHDVLSPGGRRQYLRVRLSSDGGALTASAVGDSASHLVVGLSRAEGLAVVPAEVTSLPAGATVTVLLLGETA